jgi:hypothetical protein
MMKNPRRRPILNGGEVGDGAAVGDEGAHDPVPACGRLRGGLRREGGAEECRERDGAPLVALRSANDGVPSDFDGILGDDDSASREVEVADAERGDLTPAETGVSEEQDQSFVLAARCGEIADLLMAEFAMSAGDLAGESGVSRDIGRHPPIAKCHVEDAKCHSDGSGAPSCKKTRRRRNIIEEELGSRPVF